MASMPAPYPATINFDPPREQNRWTVLVRIILAIPMMFVLFFLSLAAGVIGIIAWFAILFTGRYPAGLLTFSIGYLRWSARFTGYMYLLTDKYPPYTFEEVADYPIRVRVAEELEGRNRMTTFFRLILAIPHTLIVGVLIYLAQLIAFISWFAALFTGIVPAGLHSVMVACLRWQTRVNAYTMLLVDEYPPFAWESEPQGA